MMQDRVDMFLMTNQKYLPPERIQFLRERMLMADESRFQMLSTVELKDPTTLC